MNIKRTLALFSVVAVLGGGYHLYNNSNPYNSKNVTFINKQLDDFSNKMKDFLEEDFVHFESIMINLRNGEYDKCSKEDIYNLNKYMDVILSCNFSSYEAKHLTERQKSGFLINFENYFQVGSEEYWVVKWASEQYQKVISRTYKSANPNFEKMAEDCGLDYNTRDDRIARLNPFARYIVLKLIRPVIDINDYNDEIYAVRGKSTVHVPLSKIDAEISRCLKLMENSCTRTLGHTY